MKAVVLGGGGYLGRPLVRLLRGHVETISASQHGGDEVDEQVDIPVLQNMAAFFRRQVRAKRNDRCSDCVQSEPMKVEVRAVVQ